MVIPDYSRHLQDVKPGFVRELHQTLADKPLVYRNAPKTDYDALVSRTDLFTVTAEAGYIVGLPYGRHLKLFYEFDDLEFMRQEFAAMLNDLGRMVVQRSEAQLMVLDYTDFPHRHRVNPVLVGAEFDEPLEWTLMRCRDVREVDLPPAPDGVRVRAATPDDGEALGALEERLNGEGALAPPLPGEFFTAARAVIVAEVDGTIAGYLRLLNADKRGLRAEEFAVNPDQAAPVGGALLHEAFRRGREDNRRAMTLRVALASVQDPLLAAYAFRPSEQGLSFQRPADPRVVERRRDQKVKPRVKVGKIWGRY